MSEKLLSRLPVSATNTPPVINGSTYSFAFSGTTNTLTLTYDGTGANTHPAAGDVFVDLTTGVNGLIAGVSGNDITITSGTTLATPFTAGTWQIHKTPSNLKSGTTPARSVTVQDPESLLWNYMHLSGTSEAVRPYIWNPSSGNWMAQGSGIVTVSADVAYETAIVCGGKVDVVATGPTFSYTAASGILTATFAVGNYFNCYAGCQIVTAAGEKAVIHAADPADSKLYLAKSLTLTAGQFTILPKEYHPALYWYISTVTSSGVGRINNRVVSRA